MTNDGDGDNAPRQEDAEAAEMRLAETEGMLAAGPRAGMRAAALSILGILAIAGAVFHFHFSDNGGPAFVNRLDSELRAHAELTLAANEGSGRLAVVPSWPMQLYDRLRRDIAIYASLAAAAALCWGWSARARARRDAYLVERRLTEQVDDLRQRLEQLEKRGGR